MIVKNEPITFKTVSSGKNGEQHLLTNGGKDLAVAVKVASLISNQREGRSDSEVEVNQEEVSQESHRNTDNLNLKAQSKCG